MMSTCQIMASVFHERNATHDPAEAVALLKRIDTDARPLYAAMLADTIVEKGLEEASTLDANQLVTCVLRNEMAKWDRLGIDAAHVNALFLASILGSFDPNDDHPAIQKLREQEILPSANHIQPMHWNTLRAFTGAPASNDDILPGIQPDILAECFVVQRLLGALPAQDGDAEHSQAAARGVWQRHGAATHNNSTFVLMMLAISARRDHNTVEAARSRRHYINPWPG